MRSVAAALVLLVVAPAAAAAAHWHRVVLPRQAVSVELSPGWSVTELRGGGSVASSFRLPEGWSRMRRLPPRAALVWLSTAAGGGFPLRRRLLRLRDGVPGPCECPLRLGGTTFRFRASGRDVLATVAFSGRRREAMATLNSVIAWPPRVGVAHRRSVALGLPWAGGLLRGVLLPPQGRRFFTWDPVLERQPDRADRRWGTDRLVRIVLRVVRQYAAAHPGATRLGIGDLARPHGGWFGPRHQTHQNGLDVDVYYPRTDGRERPPDRADQIDRTLAQDLVDRFVRAGAVRIFVGPLTGLRGPPGVVQVLGGHDNHVHVRIATGC